MSKHRIPNEKWMEFIDEVVTQMLELEFGEYYKNTGFDNVEDKTYTLTDEAQDFFNERYDEVETLLENTLDITNDKPEYYES
tara:strand:+ start:1230 stop:1475 length:246 start_codon:yes stop_codon:yes gene_type:complete